jgi:DNA-binding NarL/FixJ family response regulator
MSDRVVMVLIAVSPGPLRNSLQALMATVPQIEIIAESKDADSLLRLGTQFQPDLVLMEAGLFAADMREVLCHLHTAWAQARTVVLVENAREQGEAEAAGADVVLYKGFRAARLLAIVEELLCAPAALPQEEWDET